MTNHSELFNFLIVATSKNTINGAGAQSVFFQIRHRLWHRLQGIRLAIELAILEEYAQDTRIYLSLKNLSVEINCQILSLIYLHSSRHYLMYVYRTRTQDHGNGFCISVGRALAQTSRFAGSIPHQMPFRNQFRLGLKKDIFLTLGFTLL